MLEKIRDNSILIVPSKLKNRILKTFNDTNKLLNKLTLYVTICKNIIYYLHFVCF